MVLQTTMPIMAAPTVWMSTMSCRMIPLPMVAATAVPANAPAAFRTEAMMTAWCGRMTRVETTVAMALGASVQPLTNSAARMRPSQGARWRKLERSGMGWGSGASGVLDDDVAQDVGEVLAGV